ncbi:MAG: type VI secretion system ATPase TssH [Helicobacteraceae bacterium]|jgi:type VI secretion system protein VasG|nr:type VI secretion system ATPase TssH [Helicobacteraceae bacterium]
MKLELKRLISTLDEISKERLQTAATRCVTRSGSEIVIEDLLYAMIEDKSSLFNALLAHYSVSTEDMTKSLQYGLKMGDSESSSPIFSSALVGWLEEAYKYAKLEADRADIDESALLISLLDNGLRYAATAYYRLLKDIDAQEAKALMEGLAQEASSVRSGKQSGALANAKSSELEKYTTDLTQLAREDKIDPIFCRDNEIRQAIDILLRRRKNNPILVGEAGVGKTAVVEGLALKIVKEDIPTHLRGAKLLSLDLGAMQAGASVKGEFERRLSVVINAIRASSQFTVLFIDESHTLIGAGGNEGGSDAANLLKPALARGDLRTIAATTWLEYRKYFEKDAALSRRFQKINLLEPSVSDTVTILRGIARKYEEAHGVYIEDAALQSAAALSARYITGRRLPDKAIDVLDTACANVKISAANRPFEISRLDNERLRIEREIAFLERDDLAGLKDYSRQIAALKTELAKTTGKLKTAEDEYVKQKESLEKIKAFRAEGKKEEVSKERQKLLDMQSVGRFVHDTVSPKQISEVISAWTGVPLGSMIEERMRDFQNLKAGIKERIAGQDQAIDYLDTFLQISLTGLKKENAPSGVFLLVGPSGVGKTETALALADLMYGGEQFLISVNMTEFQEKHTISRLIGSPPGYVGYGEGGQLTDPVRVKPYSVVLFDEIEKAHPDILNIFYQICDKGIINDGEGRVVDFKNTIIVMTSNLAADEIGRICSAKPDIKLDELIQLILPVLSRYFKPALLGRMNAIPYVHLSDNALKRIVRLKLSAIERQLSVRDIMIEFDDNLTDKIVEISASRETGARNVELIINTNVAPKISSLVLENAVKDRALSIIRVEVDANNEIVARSVK